MAVQELRAPEAAPIARIVKYCEALPAASIDTIMVDQLMVSIVAKTLPRNRSSTCFRRVDPFRTELTATLAREMHMKHNAHPQ